MGIIPNCIYGAYFMPKPHHPPVHDDHVRKLEKVNQRLTALESRYNALVDNMTKAQLAVRVAELEKVKSK